jgi:hypothetical protein
VFVADVICFTIFSGNSSQKRDLQIYFTNLPMFTIKFYRHILHATILWILNSNTWDLDSMLGGLQDTCHQRFIFQICWKIRIEDLRLDKYLGHEQSQPRRSQESTRRTPSRWSSGELEKPFRNTRTPAVLGYEELSSGACQTRVHRTVHVAYFSYDTG